MNEQNLGDNTSHQTDQTVKIVEQSKASKIGDFFLGVLIFGAIDGILFWIANSLLSSNSNSMYLWLVALFINLFAIFYFQKRKKYLMWGILALTLSPIILFFLAFGACLLSASGVHILGL